MIFAILVIALAIRLLPFLTPTENLGVDHWYWLALVKAIKKDRKIAPSLPNYRLEKEQWLPPLFPWLLSRFPIAVIENQSRPIAIMVDLLRLGFLFFALYLFGLHNTLEYAVAGIVYATTPIVSLYNFQLNPRSLAALLLDFLMVLLILALMQRGNLWLWSGIAGVAGLVLLSHKMTAQLFLFVLLCMPLCAQHPALYALIPAAFTTAMILSGGYYRNFLKAHWDIVKFWSREWPWLGADPLKNSPLYGDPAYKGALRQFEPGLKNFIKRIISFLIGNYAPAASGAFVLVLLTPRPPEPMHLIGLWLGICLLFALLTIVVPLLRGLGFGNLYLYNAIFPAAIVLGYNIDHFPRLGIPFVFLYLALNIVALWRAYRHLSTSAALNLPTEVLLQIKTMGDGAWLTFPMQFMEPISYLANKPVLWGGHGYGFDSLRQVFPVLRRDVRELINVYDLRFMLIHHSYGQELDRIPVEKKLCFHFSEFDIFELLK